MNTKEGNEKLDKILNSIYEFIHSDYDITVKNLNNAMLCIYD